MFTHFIRANRHEDTEEEYREKRLERTLPGTLHSAHFKVARHITHGGKHRDKQCYRGNQVQNIREVAQVVVAHRLHFAGRPRFDVTDKVNHHKYEDRTANHDEEHLQEVPDKVS